MAFYNVLDIANYIVKRCNYDNKVISNLKLQKILYFVQAEFLVVTGNPCFFDKIEAWSFGPVILTVYNYYKGYGAGHIPVLYNSDNMDTVITENHKKLINNIIDECSKYSTVELTDISVKQTPWLKSYRRGHFNIISNESIQMFFKN